MSTKPKPKRIKLQTIKSTLQKVEPQLLTVEQARAKERAAKKKPAPRKYQMLVF